jgi:hypothetical protein
MKVHRMKNKLLKVFQSLACSLMAIAIVGCASARGPQFARLEQAPSNQAVIYFYRTAPESWVKSQAFYIYVNGEKIGCLPYRCYFNCTVTPGKTTIMCDNKKTDYPVFDPVAALTKKRGRVELDLSAGNIYFVQLQATNKFTHIEGNFSIEDQQTALQELANTTLAP